MSENTSVDDVLANALGRLQRQIEALYQLEPTPAIAPFVRVSSGDAREQIIVRQSTETLELIVLLPEKSIEALVSTRGRQTLDAYLGAVEGISHFIHLAERARTRLPTTLLELELQAEVDKFAILLGAAAEWSAVQLYDLHRRLYEDVSFLHTAVSERGQRYRLANELAAKLWSQLLPRKLDREALGILRRFYRAGQAEKIRIASA